VIKNNNKLKKVAYKILKEKGALDI